MQKEYIDSSVGINEVENQLFDFNQKKVQTITINQLERTNREHDVYGNPLMGIYHCELLRNLEEIAQRSGLHITYDEIFAANGGATGNPGVAILPQVEQKYGERAIEAHVLRRVYANMVISDFDTNELTTQMAVAFHQDGIQVGFGNQVRICHNLTMLGSSQTASTYGKDKVDVKSLLSLVRSWLDNAGHTIEADREQIRRMKSIGVGYHQSLMMLGALSVQRVRHDTRVRDIRISDDYPLNSAQINRLTESLESVYHRDNYGEISLWEWYNCATELHKAGRSEIPSILPQNIALARFIDSVIG